MPHTQFGRGLAARRYAKALKRLRRYDKTGTPADLSAAVALLKEATEATAVDDPDRAQRFEVLSALLHRRYCRVNGGEDFEALSEAADASDSDQRRQARDLSTLTDRLRDRLTLYGPSADLDEAVQAARTALSATKAMSPQHPRRVLALAALLHERFEVTRRVDDLDEAADVLLDYQLVKPPALETEQALEDLFRIVVRARHLASPPTGRPEDPE